MSDKEFLEYLENMDKEEFNKLFGKAMEEVDKELGLNFEVEHE